MVFFNSSHMLQNKIISTLVGGIDNCHHAIFGQDIQEISCPTLLTISFRKYVGNADFYSWPRNFIVE